MPGVPKELIEHSLNVNPTATPKKAEASKILGREKRSHQERTRQATRGWIHQRSLPPRMAGESNTRSKKEQQRVEDVRRLHRPQQALP